MVSASLSGHRMEQGLQPLTLPHVSATAGEIITTQGGYDMVQKLFLDFFRRRLSQRPTAEELEQRNILKRK